MYLDIIEGLDILGTNELIKCFCLVMVNSGMPPTLCWQIKFEDHWNSNNSRKVLVAKLFFAYGYIYTGVTYQCSFLLRLCRKYFKVNVLMLKCFKMIFQRLEVWKCFFHRSNKLIQFHEMGGFYCSKACLQYFKIIFQSAGIFEWSVFR